MCCIVEQLADCLLLVNCSATMADAYAEPAQEEWLDVLHACLQHAVGPLELTILSSSSKWLQQRCVNYFKGSQDFRAALLLRGVEACSTAAFLGGPAHPGSRTFSQAQQLRALQWLLVTCFTPSQLLEASPRLLGVRNVSLQAAELVVAAGMQVQFTVEQLLETAHSRLEGFETWVQADKAWHIPTGLPPAFEAVCCISSAQLQAAFKVRVKSKQCQQLWL